MIRRRLLRGLPALAHFYGLKPWEVVGGTQRCLTFAEISEFRRQVPKPPKPPKGR